MKSRKVKVNITTYKEDIVQRNMNKEKEKTQEQNKDKKRNQMNPNKYICSICLNSKQEESNENKRNNSKSCPICQLSCDICIEKARNNADKAYNKTRDKNILNDHKHTQTKSVQTNTDLNKSMNLLNEVLTVFQSRKTEVKSKTVTLKDASVSTNDVKMNAKLSVSKVLQISIGHRTNADGKFVVMSSKVDRSNLDLIKHKSSSIPQMKLEQLKYSLKEKTKSKDVVEEVNRMFATVKRNNNDHLNRNRPSIRNGPRILPVVETTDCDRFLKANEAKITQNYGCKCCQTNMSSGDSIKCCHNESKTQCCQKETCDKAQCCHKNEDKCEKCVYMMCSHYKNSRKMQAGVMICQKCRDGKNASWIRSDRSFEGSG